MNATEEKPQQINGVGQRASSVRDDFGVNDAGTGSKIDAPVTQADSLDVLFRALVRARPDLPVHLRPLASLLAEQLKNYEGNREGLRPMILRTIDRLTINAEDRDTPR